MSGSFERIAIKLFQRDPKIARPEGHAFIEVFHDWIKRKELAELMIDVADYGHVHAGPSVYFCGHESDYIIDDADGRAGLVYRRKRAPQPKTGSAIDDGLARLLDVATRLAREDALRGFELARDEITVTFFDRLHHSNDEAGFAQVRGPVEEAFGRVAGAPVAALRVEGDPRAALTVRARAR